MKKSTRDRVEGKFHEVKGKVKEKVGRAGNDPKMQAKGLYEKTAGKVQTKIGEIEKVLGR